MKTFTKKLIALALTLLLAACLCAVTLAEATASLKASRSLLTIGNSLSLTLTFKAADIGAVEGTVTYDPEIFEFKSGHNIGLLSAGTLTVIAIVDKSTDPNTITATVEFTALKAGVCVFKLSSSRVYGFDAALEGSPTASVSVEVTDSFQAPDDVDAAALAEAIEVTVNGESRYMWRDLSSIPLPAETAASTILYGENEIDCAVDQNNGDSLVYLTDRSGQRGLFYVLNGTALTPYLAFFAGGQVYTIATATAPPAIPFGYFETSVSLPNAGVTRAWRDPRLEYSHLYLLYLIDRTGAPDLFVYNAEDGSVQRYVYIPPIEPVPQTLREHLARLRETIAESRELMYMLTGLFAVILALLVIVIARPASKRKQTEPSEQPIKKPEPEPLWETQNEADGEFVEIITDEDADSFDRFDSDDMDEKALERERKKAEKEAQRQLRALKKAERKAKKQADAEKDEQPPADTREQPSTPTDESADEQTEEKSESSLLRWLRARRGKRAAENGADEHPDTNDALSATEEILFEAEDETPSETPREKRQREKREKREAKEAIKEGTETKRERRLRKKNEAKVAALLPPEPAPEDETPREKRKRERVEQKLEDFIAAERLHEKNNPPAIEDLLEKTFARPDAVEYPAPFSERDSAEQLFGKKDFAEDDE